MVTTANAASSVSSAVPDLLTSTAVEVLKLGLIGLCFLLSLMGFLLLYAEQKRNTVRHPMLSAIRMFSWINLAVALIVGGFTFAGSYFDPNRELENALHQTQRQLEKSREQMAKAKAERKSHDEALYRLTVDHLEDEYKMTYGKRIAASEKLGADEINLRRLRRAIFVSMHTLNADATILEKTLAGMENRGIEGVGQHKAQILKEFPELRRRKLQWLQNSAVPALNRAMDEAQHSIRQSPPQAEVELPQGVWILDDEPAKVFLTPQNNLAGEIETIKEKV